MKIEVSKGSDFFQQTDVKLKPRQQPNVRILRLGIPQLNACIACDHRKSQHRPDLPKGEELWCKFTSRDEQRVVIRRIIAHLLSFPVQWIHFQC
jgi:hypothetical protein